MQRTTTCTRQVLIQVVHLLFQTERAHREGVPERAQTKLYKGQRTDPVEEDEVSVIYPLSDR